MPSTEVDITIIGAGLSGLYAARILHQAGLDVRVLEARDRVGGRTWTQSLGEGVVDFGGQWIGPHQKRARKLVAEMGCSLEPSFDRGRKVLDLEGQLSKYKGTIPRISIRKLARLQWTIYRLNRLAKQVPCGEPWRAHRALEWDSMTLDEWLQQHAIQADVVALFNSAIRVIFGADSSELSLLHVLHYVQQSGGLMNLIEIKNGNQQWRVTGGTQQLSEWLAQDLPIALESPVQRVEERGDRTRVYTPDHCWNARFTICAVPPHLLNRIQFEPKLPDSRIQLQSEWTMGATVKVFVLYPRPFWLELGYSGEAVCTEGPFSVSFDNFTSTGQPGLLVFLTGSPARGWSTRSPTERRRLILDALCRYFGPEASDPIVYQEIDWSTEPYSGGAPVSNPALQSLTSRTSALIDPVGRIHWAGTETARESTGFMEGALQAGERAAQEILERNRALEGLVSDHSAL